MRKQIETYWRELAGAMRAMPFADLSEAADRLMECNRRGGHIFIAGNGGSAATASHFACDLAKGTRTPGAPAFRAIALTDNVPLLTAWGNSIAMFIFCRPCARNISAATTRRRKKKRSAYGPRIFFMAGQDSAIGSMHRNRSYFLFIALTLTKSHFTIPPHT